MSDQHEEAAWEGYDAAQRDSSGEWHDKRQDAPQDRLIANLLTRGGGTYASTGKPFDGTGYVVADPDLSAVGITNASQVATWLASEPVSWALRMQGRYIGKWTDPETGETEISISDIFGSRETALTHGRQRLQKSIGWIVDGIYQEDIEV